VAGLVNVRGTLVTVVEGWKALGQPAPAPVDGGGTVGTTVLLQVGAARKTIGFTVDEVIDMLAVSGDALERREALPGLDPRLVRAVGRRSGLPFVVLDTDALLGPILTT
jgi:chemotaxis signal transduction protein